MLLKSVSMLLQRLVRLLDEETSEELTKEDSFVIHRTFFDLHKSSIGCPCGACKEDCCD